MTNFTNVYTNFVDKSIFMMYRFVIFLASGSGSEEDSDEDFSSEDISEEDDFGELDSDESEGKDWSDLEREAAEDDEDDDDDNPRRGGGASKHRPEKHSR